MNTLSKSEKNEFFHLYKKDKKSIDIFLRICIAVFCAYFAISAIESLSEKNLVNAFSIIFFGIIIVYAINVFRSKVLYKPLTEIKKNHYRVYYECVIDKERSSAAIHSEYEAKHRNGGNRITYYYVSSISHKNAEAVSAENWNSIQIGDTVCFVEIGKIMYAFKPSTIEQSSAFTENCS